MVTRNSDTDYHFDRPVHAPLSSHDATNRPPKPDRSRIDLSDYEIAKQWVKKLGKSKEEITAAISKAGDNAKTVMKELRTLS